MSGYVQVEVWLHEYKLEALSSVLEAQGSTVEKRAQEMLTDLYADLVPHKVQQEIRTRIDEESAAAQAEAEAARKYTAFRVREDGQEEYFQLKYGMELLGAARLLRLYLRQETGAQTNSFAEVFRDREPVTAEDFEQLVRLRMENTGKVTGAFELDFDKREFSAVHIMDGWKTFAMDDVSAAAYHAFRKEHLTTDQRLVRLLDKLEDKEITSAGHLSAREISLAEEIMEVDGLLNFYLETGFDVDAVFGTQVCTAENGDWINVYANYDCAAGQVCDTLEIALYRGDGGEESRSYSLNAAEKEVLLRKMNDYCQQQTGQTLAEYSAQLMAEEMEPPTQPTM